MFNYDEEYINATIGVLEEIKDYIDKSINGLSGEDFKSKFMSLNTAAAIIVSYKMLPNLGELQSMAIQDGQALQQIIDHPNIEARDKEEIEGYAQKFCLGLLKED